MGRKIAGMFIGVVGLLRVAREFINTQYDWLLVLAFVGCLGLIIPDGFFEEPMRITRAYLKARVDYKSWWGVKK